MYKLPPWTGFYEKSAVTGELTLIPAIAEKCEYEHKHGEDCEHGDHGHGHSHEHGHSHSHGHSH